MRRPLKYLCSNKYHRNILCVASVGAHRLPSMARCVCYRHDNTVYQIIYTNHGSLRAKNSSGSE